MVSGSTPSATGGNTVKSARGIVQDHVYTILGVVETENGDRLLRIRNPWGRETYTGNWSDMSTLWSKSL